MRSSRVLLGFGTTALAVVAALGGLSVVALRLGAQTERARLREARQDRLRLALWRLDAHLAPVIGRLAGLAYSHYAPAFAPARLYRPGGEPLRESALEPSPVLSASWPGWLLLHFQAPPEGAIRSPQLPEPALAWTRPPGAPRVSAAELARLSGALGPDQRRRLAASAAGAPRLAAGESALREANEVRNQRLFTPPAVDDTVDNVRLNVGLSLGAGRARVTLGPMHAAWLGEELILYRVADVEGRTLLQGALLDWLRLRGELCGLVRDLFPRCQLRRADAAGEGQLAALPVALAASEPEPALPLLGPAPLRAQLLVAWGVALLGLVITGLALRRFAELGARRMSFVSAVSHELRAPLTAFRLHLDLLVDGMVPDEAQRRATLETLRGQAERLSELVREVLDFARLERCTFRAKLEELAAAVLFAELTEDAACRCQAAGLELCAESALPAGTRVRTDPAVLRQIAGNLVENACRYAAGASDRRLHLRARGEREAIVIEVEDHGPGVPAAERRRIFEPFVRAGDEMTREHPGVGLGLALASRFARAIGAELRLAGEPRPDGRLAARFTLRLPR
jgi:signal transduction histidine kinase